MKRYILIILGLALGAYAYKSVMKAPPPPPAPPAPPPVAVTMPQPQPILNPEELRKVTETTKDQDPNVRWEAASFLVRLNHPEADEVLYRMLAQDDATELRVKVAEMLSDRKGPRVLQALSGALQDREAPVRSTALRALGKIGDPSAASSITNLLRDVDEGVRLEAVRTLRLLQEAADEAVRRKQAEIQEQMRKQAEEEARKRAEQKK